MDVPFSTSALMLIVRNRSSSFSYSIPREALLSRVRFGLRVASRRRDRNMDDVPAGGAIPPPSKPNTTSANLTLLHNSGGRQAAAALLRDATRRAVYCYYYAGRCVLVRCEPFASAVSLQFIMYSRCDD